MNTPIPTIGRVWDNVLVALARLAELLAPSNDIPPKTARIINPTVKPISIITGFKPVLIAKTITSKGHNHLNPVVFL